MSRDTSSSRVAEFPRYHRPTDILAHAIAMPGCDDYSQARSLYAESFLANRVSRYQRRQNASLVHTPFSDARTETGPSSYQANFRGAVPSPVLKHVPAAELRVERCPFDSTTTSRATYVKPQATERAVPFHQQQAGGPPLPFTATSLSRDSYKSSSDARVSPVVNPEREREKLAAAGRLSPAYHHLDATSTNKGDFSSCKPGHHVLASCDVIRQKSPPCTKVLKSVAQPKVSAVAAGKPLVRVANSNVIGGSFVESIQSLSRASYLPVTFVQ